MRFTGYIHPQKSSRTGKVWARYTFRDQYGILRTENLHYELTRRNKKTGEWIIPDEVQHRIEEINLAVRNGVYQRPEVVRPIRSTPLMEVAKSYAEHARKLGRQARTIRRNTDAVQYLVDWHGSELGAKDVTPAMLINYREYLTATYKHNTASVYMRSLGPVFDFAVDQKIIPASPMSRKTVIAQIPIDNVAATDEEIRLLLDNTTNQKWIDQVTFLTYTGWRPIESCVLQWDDVHFREDYIYRRMVKHSEGAKRYQDWPLFDGLREWLRSLPRTHEPYVFGFRGTHELGQLLSRIKERIERKAAEEGIESPINPDLTLYSIRKRFATILNDRGVPPATIAEIMGHSDLRMFMKRYLTLSVDTKRDSLNAAKPALIPLQNSTKKVRGTKTGAKRSK